MTKFDILSFDNSFDICLPAIISTGDLPKAERCPVETSLGISHFADKVSDSKYSPASMAAAPPIPAAVTA